MKNFLKRALKILIVVGFASLSSCGQEEEGNVSIAAPGSEQFLYPTDAASCYAQKNVSAEAPMPSRDVEASSLQISKIQVSRKDKTKPLTIAYIKISANDASGSSVEKIYAGDELAALKDSWWRTSTREATIAAETQSIVTDCKIFLGGFKVDGAFAGVATIEAVGFEGDDTTNDQIKPFRASTTVRFSSGF